MNDDYGPHPVHEFPATDVLAALIRRGGGDTVELSPTELARFGPDDAIVFTPGGEPGSLRIEVRAP